MVMHMNVMEIEGESQKKLRSQISQFNTIMEFSVNTFEVYYLHGDLQ